MKTEIDQKDLRADILKYIDKLNNDSPIVSTSHWTLREMHNKHTEQVFQSALKDYFNNVRELRKKYKENEELNYHSENYLLLAESFGTDEDIQKAKANLEFQRKNLYTDNDLNKAAHDACNVYYYRYLKVIKANLNRL